MSDRQRLDFDAFRRERRGEPKEVTIGGSTYLLPVSLPAAVALDVIAIQSNQSPCDEHAPLIGPTCDKCDAGPDVPPETLFRMADPLFGDGVLRSIAVKHELDVDELGELILRAFELYNSEVTAPPNRAARRAKGRTTPTAPPATSG